MRELTQSDWRFVYDEFKQPFPEEEIGWKPQTTPKEGGSAMVVAYIDARSVSDRLNEVVGPGNWESKFQVVPSVSKDAKGKDIYGVLCELSVFGVTKSDMGSPALADPLKSTTSDAFLDYL